MTKVMIVDDAAFMRNMLKNIINEGGFRVVCEAANGLEAIHLFAKHHPDIVMMDITMPDMDGVTAVTEIIRLHPTARIIMCSAMGQQKTVLDAIRAGAKDFIVKPFQKDRVLQSVLNVLKQVR
jgi:two-component system chemotaxis response regulator CheY